MSTPAKIIDLNLPKVVLIGRVNVGKSTLFNKLTETTTALISNIPGTTRTRNIGTVTWRGQNFELTDTGGLTFDEEVPLEGEIKIQTKEAIKNADLILFIVDLQNELLPQEKELAKLILDNYKNKTPVILVGNKADSNLERQNAYDSQWKKLLLGEPIAVSAANGSNVGDLLDIIYKHLRKASKRPKMIIEKPTTKVAIIGKPNVGKSTLFNKLIGEQRVIESPMPHTTREPHDTLVEVDGEQILFVDTAGIRRKTKVSGELEKLGIGKSLGAIQRADLVLFLLDASEPISDQDKQLGGYLQEHAKSTIIVINKWDLSDENDDSFRNDVQKKIYRHFPHLKYAPIIFVSAATNYRTHQIFPMIIEANKAKQIVIPQDELDIFIKRIIKKHPPSRGKGVRHPKILGFKQTSSDPPVFEVAVKARTSIHPSYIHYLKNRLKDTYEFFATPIIIRLDKIKR